MTYVNSAFNQNDSFSNMHRLLYTPGYHEDNIQLLLASSDTAALFTLTLSFGRSHRGAASGCLFCIFKQKDRCPEFAGKDVIYRSIATSPGKSGTLAIKHLTTKNLSFPAYIILNSYTLVNLCYYRWILNFIVFSQQQHLRHYLGRFWVVIGKRQE